jgi:Spx/MgsR family transcriptional regulator
MYILYGIPNCDTVKKARTWLEKQKIPYEFHDYKKAGISPVKLKQWSTQVGWEILLNKKGTTWKKLDEKVQAAVTNEKAAIKVLTENTSAIKRPLIEKGDKVVVVGFDEEGYEKLFKKS